MKTNSVVFSLLLTLCSLVFAQKNNNLPISLDKSLTIGASISAGFGPINDRFSRAEKNPMEGTLGSGFSPIRSLIKISGLDANLEEKRNWSKAGGGWYKGHTRRFLDLIQSPEYKDTFESTNLIFALDIAYWDAIDGESCRSSEANSCFPEHKVLESSERYNNEMAIEDGGTCSDTVRSIEELIIFSIENGISLILGEVPMETDTKPALFIKFSGWKKPNPVCVNQINSYLSTSCLPNNGCYILPLDSIIQDLNQGLITNADGEVVSSKEFRRDGIHLTEAGSNYLAERIINLFN